MDIQRILITGNIVREIEQQIDVELYPQSFLFIEETELTEEHLQWADAYVAFKPTENFTFNNIKWVHSLGAGVDGYLFRRKWKEDVLLTRTICSFGRRISQYCLSYVLQDLQKHQQFLQKQRNKHWRQVTPDLLGKQKVMIYGTGEIGRETAELFTSFGLEVFGVSQSGSQQPPFQKVFSKNAGEEILSEIDIVINTLPLTEETYRLFGENIFRMLNGAMFINVGRGASLVEKDLLAALEDSHLRLAVLDVFEEEPLPGQSPLWEHEKIITTPHISAVTTPEEAVACFMDTLEKLTTDQPVTNTVNPANGY